MGSEQNREAAPRLDEGLQRAIVESITQGGGLPLWSILASAPQLSPEQRTVVGLLQNLGPGNAESSDDDEPVVREPGARPRERHAPQRAAESAASPSLLRRLQRELADLREVNDTLAAALGACRVCWGGDDDCPECDGDGAAGARRPDSRLFEALVLPAVKRVYAVRKARSPDGRFGAGVAHPTSTEDSP